MEPPEHHQPACHGLQRHRHRSAGSSNPIGTIFSSIFISHITVGGSFLPTKYFPTEIADLISGIIIYLCAFAMLFRGVIAKKLHVDKDAPNANAEPAVQTKKEGK